MYFHETPQLWQAVAPDSEGLFELPDMFLIRTHRDLAIAGDVIRWDSRHATQKNRNVQSFFQDFPDPEDGPAYWYNIN